MESDREKIDKNDFECIHFATTFEFEYEYNIHIYVLAADRDGNGHEISAHPRIPNPMGADEDLGLCPRARAWIRL
jgi:hypothetical protein